MSTTFINNNFIYTIKNANQVIFGDIPNFKVCGNPVVDTSKIGADVKIPSLVSYNGNEYEINTVIANAFCLKELEIKTLTIPTTVETFDVRAFCHMLSLEEVIFEKRSRLKNIRAETFLNCPKLKKIILPPSVNSMEYGVLGLFGELNEIHYCGSTVFDVQNLIYPNEGYDINQLKVFVVTRLYKGKFFGNVSVTHTQKCISDQSIKGIPTFNVTERNDYIMIFIFISLSTYSE